MKEYPFKDLPGLDNAEVENKETVQMPDGTMYKLTGKTHGRGGIKAMLLDGSRVFSNHLRLDKETVEAIDGGKSKKSPAQLSRKYDPTPYREILSDTSTRTDDVRRATAQLMASKHLAMQDVIFKAQEEHKDYNRNKKFKYGGEYQDGGTFLGFNVPQQPIPSNLQGLVQQPRIPNNAYTTNGLSVPDYANNQVYSYYFPQANNPFWTEGINQNRGLQTGRNLELTNSVQADLSYPERLYGNNEEAIRQHNTSYAKFLRDRMRQDPDKYLRAEVVDPETRRRIPVSEATDEQINASNGELFLKNLRTGKPDLVDGRLGNLGEATNNRAFPVHTTRLRFDETVDPLPNRPIQPVESIGPNETKPEVPPVGEYEFDDAYLPKEEPIGMSPEDLLFGVQAGLDITNLATLQRDNPYYQYRPLENVQSRFDPINQMAQDRGFNIAKEALERSNLPEQVKQAQLNQLTADNIQGRNQVDLTNFQGDLQNDNQNLQRVVNTINQNNQGQVVANQAYLQELQRARFVEEQQRQVYIDRLLENYRSREQNRQNINLLNQLSRNYNFSRQNGQVNYQPGQGGPTLFDNLFPFTNQ